MVVIDVPAQNCNNEYRPDKPNHPNMCANAGSEPPPVTLFYCSIVAHTVRFHARTIILNEPNAAWVSRLAIAVLRQGSNQHFRLVYSAILLPGLSGPIAVLLFVFFEL